MGKYTPVYKCGLCGDMIPYGTPQEVPSEKLNELISRVIRNQQVFNNPALYQFPMHLIHHCDKVRGCGIATFVGFMEVSS